MWLNELWKEELLRVGRFEHDEVIDGEEILWSTESLRLSNLSLRESATDQ